MTQIKALVAAEEARLPETLLALRAAAKEHAPEAMKHREYGYSITNAADESVVRIYDEISWFGINAADLVQDIDAITSPRMRVEINSPGGSVFDGIAIYNALRNHPAFVTTRVDGLAASIASIIAQAGDKRVMQPAGQMMIHNAHGVTMGNARDHEDMVALLDQQDEVLAGIYAARSGRDADHFRELMNATTWMTADRAIAEGLADEVVDAPKKTEPNNSVQRTLHDEIADTAKRVSDTITSVERVVALRAEAGKDLSNKNRESLDGLRGELARLDGLLNASTDTEGVERWTAEDIEALRNRWVQAQ